MFYKEKEVIINNDLIQFSKFILNFNKNQKFKKLIYILILIYNFLIFL